MVNPLAITIDANKAITATFTLNTYLITPTAGLNGSISPNTPQTISGGSNQVFTITPDVGYQIADVLVDGASSWGSEHIYLYQRHSQPHNLGDIRHHHRDAHEHSDAHQHADADQNQHSNAHQDADQHSDADPNQHSDADQGPGYDEVLCAAADSSLGRGIIPGARTRALAQAPDATTDLPGAPWTISTRSSTPSARCRAALAELNLPRTVALLAALGEPQRAFPSVVIAGTKGKGSTAALTEAIARASGLRTGSLELAAPALLPRAYPGGPPADLAGRAGRPCCGDPADHRGIRHRALWPAKRIRAWLW